MNKAKEVIAHLKSLISCILAGAKILRFRWDKSSHKDHDYMLTVAIKHKEGSEERTGIINDEITGFTTQRPIE